MPSWFDWLTLAASVATFVLGVVVSVILYKLGKRVDFRSRMRRADELRDSVNGLLREWAWSSGQLREVIVMNAHRYERGEYDGGNGGTRHGYMFGKYELIGTRHNGVLLIDTITEVWRDRAGRRTVKKIRGGTEDGSVTVVGLIPFDYIEHINEHGDEFGGQPILHVRYRGPGRSPFESYYYADNGGTTIREGGRRHYFPIDEFGTLRPNRVIAWIKFTRSRLQMAAMDRKTSRAFRDRR